MKIDLTKLSLRELITLGGQDFYKAITSQNDIMLYLQQVCNKVCEENGICTFPTLSTKNLQPDYMGITLIDNIYINSKLLNLFEIFKGLKNSHYIFMLLITVIHETRHFLQYKNVNTIDPVVKTFAYYRQTIPSYALTSISYYTSATEIDARYYAYQTLKQDETFKHHIYNSKFIDKELKNSLKLSSIEQSILMSFASFDDYTTWQQDVVFSMYSVYKDFLKEIDLDQSLYLKSNLPKENFDTLQDSISFYSDLIDDALMEYKFKIKYNTKMYHKLQDQLLLMGNTEIESLQISDEVKKIAKGFLRMHAVTTYETVMLYNKLAPEFDAFKNTRKMPDAPSSENEFISIYLKMFK